MRISVLQSVYCSRSIVLEHSRAMWSLQHSIYVYTRNGIVLIRQYSLAIIDSRLPYKYTVILINV
jgi:hypothetical protein